MKFIESNILRAKILIYHNGSWRGRALCAPSEIKQMFKDSYSTVQRNTGVCIRQGYCGMTKRRKLKMMKPTMVINGRPFLVHIQSTLYAIVEVPANQQWLCPPPGYRAVQYCNFVQCSAVAATAVGT